MGAESLIVIPELLIFTDHCLLANYSHQIKMDVTFRSISHSVIHLSLSNNHLDNHHEESKFFIDLSYK